MAPLRGDHDRRRFRYADPQLRAAPVHHGQGPPNRHETSDVNAVLDGDLDSFMEAYLAWGVGRAEAAA